MAMEKQKRLVRVLLEKTRAGKLDWQEDADEKSFIVSVKDNSIRISEVERRSTVDIMISLINDEGATVDSFRDSELDESEGNQGNDLVYWPIMRELIETARRTALGSEKLITDLLNDLDDDDLPF